MRAEDGARLDVRNASVLQRQESLALISVPLGAAVQAIADQAGLEVTFSDELIPSGASVSMKADDVTVATALTRALSHTNLDVLVGGDGHLTLVPRGGQEVAVDSSGVLTGSLADAEDGEPIPHASVAIPGTDQIGFTDAHGRFLLAGLAAKSTLVRARQIGYATTDTAVVVLAGPAITTATIRLRRTPEPLRPVEVQGRAPAPPVLPASARGYRLAEGPVLDPTTGVLRSQYRRQQDRIEVSVTPYDTAAVPRTTDDTVQIVRDDIYVMYDSVTRLADNNDARVERYVDREDDVHINGHTYRGWVAHWAWEARLERDRGCDIVFVTQGRASTSSSCYQQNYATPHGLLRVRAQLGPQGASIGELTAFSNEVLAAIVSQP